MFNIDICYWFWVYTLLWIWLIIFWVYTYFLFGIWTWILLFPKLGHTRKFIVLLSLCPRRFAYIFCMLISHLVDYVISIYEMSEIIQIIILNDFTFLVALAVPLWFQFNMKVFVNDAFFRWSIAKLLILVAGVTQFLFIFVFVQAKVNQLKYRLHQFRGVSLLEQAKFLRGLLQVKVFKKLSS